MSSSAEPVSTRAPRGPDVGPPTTLILVRHGRTAMTEQHRMAGGGGTFDPSLSPAGRADAERARDLLAQLVADPLLGGSAPSLVVTSPMARTRETATVIADSLRLPVQLDPGFVENDYGHWDGLTYAEISQRWPEEMRAWQGSSSYAPPGGESLDDHVARVGAARDTLIAAHSGKAVVVVSHVTPIRAMLRAALDAGLAAMWRIRVDPCSVSVTRHWADGNAEVGCVNRVG
jgi:broad specificity phosphatase PhoE